MKAIAKTDPRIRCIRRVGRRGLAGACIEGMLSSSAPYIAVMDADLQHDERVLPQMLAKLQSGQVRSGGGDRYVEGGSAGSFSEGRGKISRIRDAADPTHAGHLAQRSDERLLHDAPRRVRRRGAAPFARRIQDPARYRDRRQGAAHRRATLSFSAGATKAKANSTFRSGWSFSAFCSPSSRTASSIRGSSFLRIVGATGIAVNLAVLNIALLVWPVSSPSPRASRPSSPWPATFCSTISLTYRDRRLRGFGMVRGFIGFCLFGAVGALTDVGFASQLFMPTAMRDEWARAICASFCASWWDGWT